jgi:hypothetical protein
MKWRVKDYSDGWIEYDTEEEARASEEAQNGALVEPAFHPPHQPSYNELKAEIERLRAALEKIANRFDWAEHPGTLEWQTREEALAALK